MASKKLVYVNKSQKEWVCKKCRKTIAVGDPYYRGRLGFRIPDIIRCRECGLESWEVTSSDYQLEVGEIVYRWQQNYSADEVGIDEITDALQSVMDDCQERFDNIPEQLQEANAGAILSERIDGLQSAIDELSCIDIERIKSDVCEGEGLQEFEEKGIPCEYDDILGDKDGVFSDELKESIKERFEENVVMEIDNALEEVII